MTKFSLAVAVIAAGTALGGHAFAQSSTLSCTGTLIEPTAKTQSPTTLKVTLGSGKSVSVDPGSGVISAPIVSDNKIQLKFRTKDYVAEYFRYTGDLFVIYKTGHLARLACTPS